MNREWTAEDELRHENEQLRKQLDLCAAWLTTIRRLWKRWDDVLSISGTPSCTEQADAWLAAREARP